MWPILIFLCLPADGKHFLVPAAVDNHFLEDVNWIWGRVNTTIKALVTSFNAGEYKGIQRTTFDDVTMAGTMFGFQVDGKYQGFIDVSVALVPSIRNLKGNILNAQIAKPTVTSRGIVVHTHAYVLYLSGRTMFFKFNMARKQIDSN